MDRPDREAARELGSIAQGPVLLATGDTVTSSAPSSARRTAPRRSA
jgi:hypothetical protein